MRTMDRHPIKFVLGGIEHALNVKEAIDLVTRINKQVAELRYKTPEEIARDIVRDASLSTYRGVSEFAEKLTIKITEAIEDERIRQQ